MITFSMIRPGCLLRRLHTAQQGSVLIMVALGLGAIMSVTGLVFEISNYASAKSRFTNAVDQALLAAAHVRYGSFNIDPVSGTVVNVPCKAG